MRINDKIPSREIGKKTKKVSTERAGSAGASLFADRLRRSEDDIITQYQLELEELKREIDRAGENLDREPTVANFKEFRDLIGTLTKKVTSEAYKVELVRSSGITHHEHEIISVINREADDLFRLIISEQKDRLAITNKIMRITGLVVDFLA